MTIFSIDDYGSFIISVWQKDQCVNVGITTETERLKLKFMVKFMITLMASYLHEG